MILTSALCIIFRPKLCPKRASSCSSSNSEVPEGVQNTGLKSVSCSWSLLIRPTWRPPQSRTTTTTTCHTQSALVVTFPKMPSWSSPPAA
ncbi:uncharacterized protein [Centroberyx affinis]|uniref:uncharacterized protein n=1 Tax=Centroberyx affinis TaxID=166261 RepID=UPI003A5BC279